MKLNIITKYNYIKRIKTENTASLGLKLYETGLSRNKNAAQMIYAWKYKFENHGFTGLTDNRGKAKSKKKKRLNIDELSREELEYIIEIYEELIDSKDKKAAFNIIHRDKTKFPITRLCYIFNVSKQGYYN